MPRTTGQHNRKEARLDLKFIKAIMIMAVLAGALSLGACAHNEPAATTSTTTTSGYHK